MKRLFALVLVLGLAACSSEKKEGNMVVQGQIKGLKKGKLYLQKMVDTVVVSVDSTSLIGTDQFRLTDDLESAEMYYLNFDTNNSKQSLMFFGEPGVITINDEVKKFAVNPVIEGSKNQEVYKNYKEVTKRFQNKQLELLEANFKAQQENNLSKSDSLRQLSEDYVKRKYLYAINFALQHPDSEASAYIALTELTNANVKYLDSINNTLTEKVQKSLYGKQLAEFIKRIKQTEKAN